MGWNEAVFRWINNWPESWNLIFLFLSEGNKLAIVRIILIALIGGMIVFGKAKGRKAAILCILAVPFANEWTDLLKAWFAEPRPCVELDAIRLRVDQLTSYGTASAHSANMAAVATVMTLILGRWGLIWCAIALGTGLSRIYVGVHYPSQVLLGWTVGILIGVAIVRIVDWFEARANAAQTSRAVNL